MHGKERKEMACNGPLGLNSGAVDSFVLCAPWPQKIYLFSQNFLARFDDGIDSFIPVDGRMEVDTSRE